MKDEEETIGLEKRVTKLEERFKGLYSMDRSISKIHDMRLIGVEGDIEDIKKEIKELDNRIVKLENEYDDWMGMTVNDEVWIGNMYNELNEKIEELESAVRALNEMNKTALAVMDRRLDNLEERK